MGDVNQPITNEGEFADEVWQALENAVCEDDRFTQVLQTGDGVIRVVLADGAEYTLTIQQRIAHPD